VGVDLLAGLDPRGKLVAFLAVQALLFIPGSQPPHVRLTSVAMPLLALLPFAGRSWRRWLRLLALSASLLALIAASAFIRSGGSGPEPHLVILNIVGKFLLVFLSLALFILNQKPLRLMQALCQMRLPQAVVVILAIGYRFACQWQLELAGVRRAWTARNFSTLAKLRKIKYISGALPIFFESLLDGAVHIHDAMVSRGFHGSLPVWQRLVFSSRDVVFLMLTALTVMAVMIF
jgi:energy-coupling factor transporter transmembrane protein EcfT